VVIDRLDVIAALAAHQQHLAPDPAPDHTVLLALPAPALGTLIAADHFAELRRTALAALASELGGGDGPLAIVEYARGVLDALWQRGVRGLVVHGGGERPGHMRAVRYRWPGALREAGASLLAPLMDLREPVRVIAPGVVRIAPGVSAPGGAACVLAAVDEGDDPARVRTHDRVWPYACERDPRWRGPWSGVLPAAGRFGTAAGAVIRARWDAHWTQLGHPDAVRIAALGLDPELEATLREAPASVPGRRDLYAQVAANPGIDGAGQSLRAASVAPGRREPRAQVIAITGIDGAGKSSQVGWLAGELRERGARVEVTKLYRQGAFLELANLLGARTRRGGPLAAFVTSRTVKLVDSLRVYRDHLAGALVACDVVLFDRHVETHLAAAASQLGWDLTGHPALAPFPAAELRFWLALDPGTALARRDQRGEPPSADEHAIGLRGYADQFARLAAGPNEIVLDATAPADTNRRVILDRVTSVLAAPHGDPAWSSLVPSRGLPRRAGPRCAVHLGGSSEASGRASSIVELGAELLALRGALDGWCGPIAGHAPEAFWLEAYAAQLVLDLWTLTVPRARIALWPEAIAMMASHQSLEVLHELARLIAPRVDVETYDPRPASYAPTFAALGAGPRAALRLARDYADQLARIAGEHGWTETLT
jgi:dTMP kinase